MAGQRTRVALFANGVPGMRVADYLAGHGDEIVRLYLHSPDQRRLGHEIVTAAGLPPELVRDASDVAEPSGIADLLAAAPDFLVTVYWAHLLSADAIGAARRGSVNFHPALLPINRGWYPHVHSIVDGSPAGVTLHALDADADTGPIWAQQEVLIEPWDTALTLYERLQSEIVDLFRETWPRIVSGEIQPVPQNEARAVYHARSEVDGLDELRLDEVMRVGDVIDRLRARSFGSTGFAWYDINGQRVYANLRLGRTQLME